jgi:hypothetical protein
MAKFVAMAAINLVTPKAGPLGPYFTTHQFLCTYEWTLQARVLHYTRLEKLLKNKHYNLLGLILLRRK